MLSDMHNGLLNNFHPFNLQYVLRYVLISLWLNIFFQPVCQFEGSLAVRYTSPALPSDKTIF